MGGPLSIGFRLPEGANRLWVGGTDTAAMARELVIYNLGKVL